MHSLDMTTANYHVTLSPSQVRVVGHNVSFSSCEKYRPRKDSESQETRVHAARWHVSTAAGHKRENEQQKLTYIPPAATTASR